MVTAKQVINSIKSKPIKGPGPTQLGSAGYDNPRDDIEKVKKIREGSIEKVPVFDNDIVNKVFVDDNFQPIDSILTSLAALANAAGVLTNNGAGALSWGAAGSGDVTAGANLTDETLVQGDGGAKGIKTTTVTAGQVTANTAKNTNVTTNLSAGTRTATTIDVNSSDGTNATLVEADTTNAGILGSDKWDEIVANTLKVSYTDAAAVSAVATDIASGFSAYRTSSQTIGTASYTAVVFGSEHYDTLGEYDTSTGIFTATTAGKYLVTSTILWNACDATKTYLVAIYKNATSMVRATEVTVGAVLRPQTITTILDLAVDDTVTIKAYQNSGGNETLVRYTNDDLTFSMQKLV